MTQSDHVPPPQAGTGSPRRDGAGRRRKTLASLELMKDGKRRCVTLIRWQAAKAGEL